MTYQIPTDSHPCIYTRINTVLIPEITYCSMIILDNSLFPLPDTLSVTLSVDFLKGSDCFVIFHIKF